MNPRNRLRFYTACAAIGAVVFWSGPDPKLVPSPIFPWSYFALLLALWAFSRVCLLMDDQDEVSLQSAVSEAGGSLIGLCLYFAVTAVARLLGTLGRELDDPEVLGVVLLPFYVSWFIWLAVVVGILHGIWKHREGFLCLFFMPFGKVEAFVERRRRAKEMREAAKRHRIADREEARVHDRVEKAGGEDLEEFFRHLQSLETVPEGITDYRGFIGEAYRRFIERQKQKTVQVTRERIQEVANLYGAWADAQRKKAEMARGYAALKRVGERIEIDALAQEVERERLLTQRAQLGVERARLEGEQHAMKSREAGALPSTVSLPVVLGRALDEAGIPKSVSLAPDLRIRHVYVIGQTQTGKTTLIQNLVRQDMECGHGCAFIDPHGDAVPELLRHVPERRIEDVVYLDFTERDSVVAFNPLDAPREQRQGLVEDFISYFGRFFETDVTTAPRMTHILRYSLLTLLESRTPKTIADLERLLVDPEFRTALLREVTDPSLREFWGKQFPDLKRIETQPILTRLSALLAPGSQLRAILTQPENRIDFGAILNQGKILLVRLSKGRGLEAATHFLGALIVTKIQQEAMARAELPKAGRRPFTMYVDEFQNYTVTSFETILAESAKYRLSVAMANQTFHGLPSSLRTAVLGNVGTIVAFRVGSEDAQVLQREIRKAVTVPGHTPTGTPTVEDTWYPTVEDLTNQKPHRAFVRLGRPEAVEAIRTLGLPPPPASAREIEQEVIAASRRQYYGKAALADVASAERLPLGKGRPDDFLE